MRRDLLKAPVAVIVGYGIPIAALVTVRMLDLPKPATAAVWSASMLVMGLACAANAKRCGRVHCHFTAPFLFAMAAVTLLFGFNVDGFTGLSFALLGNTLAVGSLLLCIGSELAFGRYFPRHRHRDE